MKTFAIEFTDADPTTGNTVRKVTIFVHAIAAFYTKLNDLDKFPLAKSVIHTVDGKAFTVQETYEEIAEMLG